jgi:hypothetical protein
MSDVNVEALSHFQDNAIRTAHPRSSRITGAPASTRAALVRRGLAVQLRTGTPFAAHYLTEEGRRLQAALLDINFLPARPLTTSVLDSLGFRPNDGCQEVAAFEPPLLRAPEIELAWSAVLGQRRVLHDLLDTLPCPWEEERPVDAVSLALEAAGEQPAAKDEYGRWVRAGYCVEESSRDGCARVSYKHRHVWEQVGHPERRESAVLYRSHIQGLESFERALEARGWKPERQNAYNRPYLIVSPKLS